MVENITNTRLLNLMSHLDRDKARHIDPQQLKYNKCNPRYSLQQIKFDVYKHYRMLKQSHPLYQMLYCQKQNQIKKTYIPISQTIQSSKPLSQTQKLQPINKYKKQKFNKSKKNQQLHFNLIYEQIQSIGS